MKRRKRAAGGGRKPQGEFGRKRSAFTTRITSATREALDRAAAKSGRSVSQEVERRLTDTLQRDLAADRQRHVRALGESFMLMVQGVERSTSCRWCDDAFTAEAIRQGLSLLISHFGPKGTPVLPKKLKDDAAKVPAELARRLGEPAEVGLSEIGHVIALIERWNDAMHGNDVAEISSSARSIKGADIQVPTEWFAHASLLRDLKSR
jgi:hypothetical protein